MWNKDADLAFVALKRSFTTAPVLQHPDPSQPYFVEADASQFAVLQGGGVWNVGVGV